MFPQALLKHKYTDKVTDNLTVFFIVCKTYFRVGFIEALDSKGIKNTLEMCYVSHGMRWRCNFHFRYVTDKILFTLQV